MLAGQHVRRADGTTWYVSHIGSTIRAAHPGMAGEEVGEVRLTRDTGEAVEVAYVLSYGHEQAHRLRLPPSEDLTIVREGVEA